jgi:hypothetical protein
MKKLFSSLAATLLCAVAFGASAQTFGPEIRLSNNQGPSLAPHVQAVGSNVYIVWSENVNTGGACTDGQGPYCGDIWFSRSTDNGTTFSPAVNLTAGTNSRNDRFPIIAAGGTQVHVFWTDSLSTGDVYTRRSTDSGANFAAEVKLTVTDSSYSRPTAALVDSAGNVHLAFYDDRPPAGSFGQIYYQCSSNAGANWSAAVNITQFDGPADQEAPRLTQGTDGTLYMLLRTTRNGLPQAGWPPFSQFVMRSQAPSTAVGCTVNWMHPPQAVSIGLPVEFANTFGGNITSGPGTGAIHTAFWSDKAGTNLVYRRGFPNGKGWETPIDISGFGQNHLEWDGNAAEHTSYGLAEDAAGKVHAVFAQNANLREGFQVGPLFYRCSNDGGVTWVGKTFATAQTETTQPRAAYSNNKFHMVWSDWRDNNFGAEIYYRNVTTGACAAAVNNIQVSSPGLAFGGQSMGTTSPPQTVTITNSGGSTATVNGISASAQFAVNNLCPGTLGAGASCNVDVYFTPDPAAGGLNSTVSVNGTLQISTTQGSPSVNLTGTAEKSLITHYYRSILRRAPDAGGKAFWEGEDVRMQNLGANVNEVWYAMAQFFYFSAEYGSFNRDTNGFVTDLYNTFFNRSPDAGGLNFWVGQINSGLPREVALAGFMFSPEFTAFTQGIFGNTAARAEVDMVGDFFRGLLARLPDDGGFNFWVSQFRTAQCQGQGFVYGQVESISNSFVSGAEYTNRNRTNPQFVGDLYNAFLRRGGDLNGVNFWVNQLNGGATKSSVRQQFIASPEFQARVNAVVSQGCLP